MEIHRPKAARSWREFGIEIGTIICGILIALALEQAAEALRWRGEVAETRRRLSVELGTLMGQAEFRARASICVQRRLDELAAVVDDAARSGRLPALGEPSYPSLFIWGTGAWQSAVSAQALPHLNQGELRGYSDAYKFIGLVDESNRSEAKVWTALYGLAGPGRPFGAAEAAASRQAIGEARYLDYYIGGMGVRAHQSLDAYGIGFEARRYQKILSRPIESLPICKPIAGPPPLHYGEAPFRTFVSDAHAHPMLPQL